MLEVTFDNLTDRDKLIMITTVQVLHLLMTEKEAGALREDLLSADKQTNMFNAYTYVITTIMYELDRMNREGLIDKELAKSKDLFQESNVQLEKALKGNRHLNG